MNKDSFIKATELLGNANSAMCSAIEAFAKEEGSIRFWGEVENASCEPILGIVARDGEVYAESISDSISLDDLTSNELFEICNKIMCGAYKSAIFSNSY